MTTFDDADRRGAEANDDGRAASTRSSYAKNWKTFETYCASLGMAALPASAEVVEMFIGAVASGALRKPGKSRLQTGEPVPFAAQTLDVLLSAVRDRHVRSGLASPTEDPRVQGLRQRYRAERVNDGAEVRKAPSLTVEDFRALCWAEVPVPVSSVTRAACVLTLLAVPGVSAPDLAALLLRDLDCADQVRLRVGGRWVTVPCSCSPGWGPWGVAPCAACLLRRLELVAPSGEDVLLFAASHRRGSRDASRVTAVTVARDIRVLSGKVGSAWPALEAGGAGLDWADDSDDALRAATVRGVGLALTGQLVWLQFRSLLLAMLLRGLRFDDAVRLPRGTSTRLPGSYRVLLPSAKNDPGGHGCWLRLPATRDDRLCVVCMLDAWIPVLDAAGAGGSSALFAPVGEFGVRVGARLSYSVAWQLLARLRGGSGVEGVSLHSMRRSFATIAYGQGASLEELREELRQVRIDTTAGYVDLPAFGDVPVGVLGMAGVGAEPRPASKRVPRVERPHCRDDHAGDVTSSTGGG